MSGEHLVSTMSPSLGQRQRAAALALLMAGGCMLVLPLANVSLPRFEAVGGGVRALAMPQPPAGPDWDNDGIVDGQDNCRILGNFDQIDVDADGYGNACDGDFDNDGIVSTWDYVILRRAFGLAPGEPRFNLRPDMDRNGVVGTSDFVRWLPTFGQPAGPSGLPCAGTIPCP